MRHQVPGGDVAEILDRALDALLDKVEVTKLGKARKPRAQAKRPVGRHVPRAVRRGVIARDASVAPSSARTAGGAMRPASWNSTEGRAPLPLWRLRAAQGMALRAAPADLR